MFIPVSLLSIHYDNFTSAPKMPFFAVCQGGRGSWGAEVKISIESFSQLPLVVVLRLQRISKYKDLPGLTKKNTTEILLTGCVTLLHGTSDRLRDDTFVYKQTGEVPCNTGCLNLFWPFPVCSNILINPEIWAVLWISVWYNLVFDFQEHQGSLNCVLYDRWYILQQILLVLYIKHVRDQWWLIPHELLYP